ncbi:MAG: Cof-type HAD-IIB family hydrolase [Acidimicrobiales bacterium]
MSVRLLLADVDGTLVTNDKVLTDRSIEAVGHLRDAGILFALTSARPPQGLAMFVEPLAITTPLGALNGALITDVNQKILEELTITPNLEPPIADLLSSFGLSVWIYQGADWFVLDPHGPHVEHESRTCQCEPTVLPSFASVDHDITKIVGVSDDPVATEAANTAMHDRYGQTVLATRSQTYFIDVTSPGASKGHVVQYLSTMFDIDPSEIATIGDMHNDISMFQVSGLSIAMGNGDDRVRQAATEVTTTNEDEGFANAVEKFILKS